jgi:two-component system cell cycle response regulator
MIVGAGKLRPVIMIVDDDADTCTILSGFLKAEFEVLTAQSPAECFRILSRETVDLVLLDLLMPEMNGLAVLGKIGSNPTSAKTPVIVLTAWDDVDALTEAKRLGAKEYILKPIFRRRLLRSVRAHLQPKFRGN